LNAIVGQNATGMAFNILAQTEEEFVDLRWLLKTLEPHDAICGLQFFWASSSIQSSNISVSFDPDRSTAKAVRITAAIGKMKFTANLISLTHL
jgi:hypothetical protein